MRSPPSTTRFRRPLPVAVLAVVALIVASLRGVADPRQDPLTSPATATGDNDTTEETPALPMDVTSSEDDRETAATLVAYARDGHRRIHEFFGEPIARRFAFRVLKDRAAFDAFFRDAWGIEQTQCWWVAAGLADDLVMLSPRVWSRDACEHDGEDADHVREIVMHELVHVYHGQKNEGFEELEDIGWFIEGLATYVSGQLDDERRARLRSALAEGPVIERLEDGWSGDHRYAIAGTLVEKIDLDYGRAVILELVRARDEAGILRRLDIDEETLLQRWREHAAKAPE